MNRDEKSNIVDTLINFAKKSKLNNEQKGKIVEVLDNMNILTETQRERFIMYYGLNTNGLDFRNMAKIAKIYGSSVSAIRLSLVTVRNKLVRLEDEFKVLEDVVKESIENAKKITDEKKGKKNGID